VVIGIEARIVEYAEVIEYKIKIYVGDAKFFCAVKHFKKA